LYLGLDAILSGILVVGGLHFLGPSAWVVHEKFTLAHSGVIPMPLDDLLDYVTRQTGPVYWLGPVTGDKYTLDSAKGGEAVITHFPKWFKFN